MTLTQAELIDAVVDTGRRLNARQLRRMREARLLDSPTHVHRRGVGGSTSFYPATAVARVCRIIDLLSVRRSHDFALLCLWRDGEPVSASRVRAILKEQFEPLQSKSEEIHKANDGDTFWFVDGFVQLAEAEGEDRGPLSPAERVTAKSVVLLATQGVEAGWDTPDEPDGPTPRELVERMHGVDGVRREVASGVIPGVVSENLEGFDVQREYERTHSSGGFNPLSIADEIAGLSDLELEKLPGLIRTQATQLEQFQALLPTGPTSRHVAAMRSRFNPTSVTEFAMLVQFALITSRVGTL